ncbi:MAG: amidohydrolase, partial [Robiginitalea sp.]
MSLALVTILFSCKGEAETQSGERSTATVYYGGDIITMEGDVPEYAEALVVRDGFIEFAGDSAEAMKKAGPGHKMVNLEGKTLLPGFIDGHAHFGNFGLQAVGALLLAPPDA